VKDHLRHSFGIVVCATMGFVATLAASGVAQADGMPAARVVVEQPLSWTGFYIGAHFGWGWGGDDRVRDLDGYNYNGDFRIADNGGSMIGLQIGYNLQFQRVVAGIEADFGLSGFTAEGQFPAVAPSDSNASVDVDRYATITGRLGFLARDDLLIYAKAGWGWAHTEVSFIDAVSPVTLVRGIDRDRNLSGPVWGGGLEWAWSRWFSVKVEYLHFDLDDTITHTALDNFGDRWRFDHHVKDIDTVKVGFNIRLNAARDVAPAK
jgi:outer membrane immunogenic protein